MKLTEKAAEHLLFFALLLAGVALVYSASVHLPMFLDGAYWYFNVIQNHHLFYDVSYMRVFGTVFQLPALAWLALWGRNGTRGAVVALDLAYSLHPLVSLLATYLILRWRKQTELFVYPVFSFATATASTLAFGVGVVPDALSVFWPLFALVVTRTTDESLAYLSAVVLLALALAFNYELSILFFVGLLALTYFQREAAHRIALLITFALCLGWLLYRSLGPTAGNTEHFLFSIKQKIGLFRDISIFMIAGLAVALVRRSKAVLYGSLAIAAAFAAFGAITQTFDLFITFNARVTAIPLACLIAVIGVLAARHGAPRLAQRHLVAFVAGAVLIAALHQAVIARKWRARTEPMYQLLARSQGCVYLPEDTPHLGNDWALPYLSTLVQGKAEIETIVFARQKSVFPNEGPCELFTRGFLADEHNRMPIVGSGHFDFHKAMR